MALPSADAQSAQPRTWGVLWSCVWVAAVILVRQGVGRLFELEPLKTAVAEGIGHAAFLLLVWSVELLVIVLAVRMLAVPLAPYLGWVKPRLRYLLLGLVLAGTMHLAEHALAYALIGRWFDLGQYRQAMAQGLSPWWFVLKWWPAYICAPIVEESVYRGFLWRGLEASRLGQLGALLASTALFALLHYDYYYSAGQFYAGTLILYVLWGLIFGALRWISGGTTAPIIVHALSNLFINLHPVLISPWVP
jgi:membrane protease YdiL (CAAX protease family)